MSRRHLSLRSAQAGIATPANNEAPSIPHNMVLPKIFPNDISAPEMLVKLRQDCTPSGLGRYHTHDAQVAPGLPPQSLGNYVRMLGFGLTIPVPGSKEPLCIRRGSPQRTLPTARKRGRIFPPLALSPGCS
jgi:hypothetical protein